MKTKWVLNPTPRSEVIELLTDKVNLPHPLAVILAQRGIDTYDKAEGFFRPNLSKLHDSYLMKDMDKAVERVLSAVRNNENILVYGDYDVDGTTSVAMMYDFLKSFYSNVDFYVPSRYSEGYGISKQGIDFADDNDFRLIIALDCGIKAVDKIAYAKTKNIDFIICDHHLPGDELPDAVAVLDPKRPDSDYPFKELSGCGVGFKLLQALAAKMNIPDEIVFSYLDLLVVSIAADIVDIVGENRILAFHGLKRLKESPRPGLDSLLGENQKDAPKISDIVFSIAPKINATGRLEHASKSVELLIEKDLKKVENFAKQIKSINDERRETDGNVTEEALELIIQNSETDRYTTVVYHPEWHKGVLGIVASRLTEHYFRPTLVLTRGDEGIITGSARSVKDFDIYSVIDSCSDLLTRYGGHRFAAGLTMPEENLIEFKEKFEQLVKERIRPIQRIPSIEIDAELSFSQITSSFLKILRRMEPFGPGNMTPLFISKDLIAGEIKTMGKDHSHLRLSVADIRARKRLPAVAFGMGDLKKDFQKRPFDMVYSIDENHWKGNVYLQINIRDVIFKD